MIVMTCYVPKERMKLESEFIKVIPSNAPNVFQWSLIQGLVLSNVPSLEIVNALSVGTWPNQHKKMFLRGKFEKNDYGKYIEIATINLPVLKQLSRYFKARHILRKSSESEVLIYSTYLPFLAAAAKSKNKRITLIVPDLPLYYNLTRKKSLLSLMYRKINNRITQHYLKGVDRFVLLTEAMHSALNVGVRPYIVLEGIAPIETIESQSLDELPKRSDRENKIILFYSGSLTIKFGVLDLLTILETIPDKKLELWICGKGEGSEMITNYQKTDSRLKYFGFLPIEKVVELQQQASILINPRKPEGTYTKYSFPSKTMEYMLSGKPVVMYKLPGLPDEYLQHLFIVREDELLADCIQRIIGMTNEELGFIGESARNFVINEKGPNKQASRILKLINGGTSFESNKYKME